MFLLIIMEKYMTNRDVSLLAFRIFSREEMKDFSKNTMVFNEATGEFLNLKEHVYEEIKNNKFRSIQDLLDEIYEHIPDGPIALGNGQYSNLVDVCFNEVKKLISERNHQEQIKFTQISDLKKTRDTYDKYVAVLKDLDLQHTAQNQQQGQTVIPPRPNAPSVAPLPVWW